ncbi:MAG TPA: hut operon positive regulator HutP [Firmicutes bacterium]|nr:hut operon positive regulator HutP [Bacillota bacterium]
MSTKPDNLSVARAAIRLALSASREEELELKRVFGEEGIRAAAVDFGGEFYPSIAKAVERALVAAKREGVIRDTHLHLGAVAGATREAMAQLANRALGLNVGGKIGVAKGGEHLAVAVFSAVGLLHLDDVGLGLAHRSLPA